MHPNSGNFCFTPTFGPLVTPPSLISQMLDKAGS